AVGGLEVAGTRPGRAGPALLARGRRAGPGERRKGRDGLRDLEGRLRHRDGLGFQGRDGRGRRPWGRTNRYRGAALVAREPEAGVLAESPLWVDRQHPAVSPGGGRVVAQAPVDHAQVVI